MLRALSKGFMPSNEQLIINLRTILAMDLLNPNNPELSDSGRLLVKYTKQWLQQFIQLLQHKNSEDQIQDFIWFLSKSRISVDVEHLSQRATKAKAKADTAAGMNATFTYRTPQLYFLFQSRVFRYASHNRLLSVLTQCSISTSKPPIPFQPIYSKENKTNACLAYGSLQTVGSLLLTNSDFRLFLADLNIVVREVFKDTAVTVSGVAEEVGTKLEPSKDEQQKLKHPGGDEGPRPTNEDLSHEVAEASQIVTSGAVKVAKSAQDSLAEKLSGDEKETLLYRLKQAIIKLRQRPDYSDSVSTLSLLLKRYALAYSRAAQETLQTAQDDVHENPETDRALKNFYTLIRSFGDSKQWDSLEEKFDQVMKHSKSDPQFESLMNDLGNSLQSLLTDPSFLDQADEKFQELRRKSREVGSDSPIRQDVDAFLEQAQKTLESTLHDEDIARLVKTTKQIAAILSPAGEYYNTELIQDSINVFVPLFIAAIQYIPIPRLEISTPDIDLLLENLILEPGRTVNNSSFFPYRVKIETHNAVEIRKARFRTTSTLTSLITLKFDGLSVRGSEIGYWLRAHSGLLRFVDSGIASFALDARGLDVHLEVAVSPPHHPHRLLALRAVRVHIHRLRYSLRRSSLRWVAWLLAPLLRPLLRKALEARAAAAIADALRAADRELVFARERLRATRVADPQDLATFVRAVAARMVPADDPDVYTRVGVSAPRRGIFAGVYAPGSLVKVWDEEARGAAERVDEWERGGWRNAVFDVHTALLT